MTQMVTFHNKAAIKVQAQIFADRELVSACLAGPGETHTLAAESMPYDIYFKNGATGWVVARELDSNAQTFTLSQNNKRYIIT
ncbi:MAG: hypothetical protein KJ069_12605 [Anaerolineae bacterium]|nr:hypothetical protein [Anaerolineae bacterium]